MAKWVARFVTTILLTVVMGQQVCVAQDGGGECCLIYEWAALYGGGLYYADSYQCCCDVALLGEPCPCPPETGCDWDCLPACVPPTPPPYTGSCETLTGFTTWEGDLYVAVYVCADCTGDPDVPEVPCGEGELPKYKFDPTADGRVAGGIDACKSNVQGPGSWAWEHCYEYDDCNIIPPEARPWGVDYIPSQHDDSFELGIGSCNCFDSEDTPPIHTCTWTENTVGGGGNNDPS